MLSRGNFVVVKFLSLNLQPNMRFVNHIARFFDQWYPRKHSSVQGQQCKHEKDTNGVVLVAL